MTLFAEGRVENQKLYQTAALLSFGWVFGFQLDSLEKHLITLLAFTFTVPLLSGDPAAHYTSFDGSKLKKSGGKFDRKSWNPYCGFAYFFQFST